MSVRPFEFTVAERVSYKQVLCSDYRKSSSQLVLQLSKRLWVTSSAPKIVIFTSTYCKSIICSWVHFETTEKNSLSKLSCFRTPIDSLAGKTMRQKKFLFCETPLAQRGMHSCTHTRTHIGTLRGVIELLLPTFHRKNVLIFLSVWIFSTCADVTWLMVLHTNLPIVLE